MTGIIVSNPPTVEVPPGNNAANPQSLPAVTYQYAVLNFAQTWGAKQTFPLGNISVQAADIVGNSPLSARGSVTMFPNSAQGSGPWSVVDPFGNAISTAGTTTQGLQEAINAAKAGNWPLDVLGRGTINCSSTLIIPNLFFGSIFIAPSVIVNFSTLGAAALVTIDSQENSTLRLLGEFVQTAGDTGDVILFKPTNTVPVTGNTGVFASTIDFGTIVPATTGAAALHLDSTNGNFTGNRTNIVDINGGVAGLKITVSATTPHVIQENQFSGQYWHGMSAFGVQMGTSTTNANFLRRNMFYIGRISPNNNAAIGFSTFSNGDIIDVGGINAEEAPGGFNLADGIVWQSGATGNYARVGQMSVGTGVGVLNSSGNASNFSVVSAAAVGGSFSAPAITSPTGLVKADVGLGNVANVDTTNAANISSGTLPAARLPALTGDVTTAIGTVATTIAANAVTNTKAAQMAANTIKANNTAGLANAADITVPQLTAMLSSPQTVAFTTGAALTYTTPANAKYIIVELIGGGGGSAGSGTTPGNGTGGGSTTFGTLTAGGGGGGTNTASGGGGTATGGDLNIPGSNAGNPTGASNQSGGNGGNAALYSVAAALSGIANVGVAGGGYGAGGSGAGNSTTANTGGGGGGGGYVKKLITAPAATYTYTVGTAGGAGAAGTGGFAGAGGTTGVIIVTAYFQ